MTADNQQLKDGLMEEKSEICEIAIIAMINKRSLLLVWWRLTTNKNMV